MADEYNTYKPIEGNWYQSFPYCFRTDYESIYLPLSPQNISITTHFATNTITTLYSTVEEHSEIRYFDISIRGTTGFSPRYIGAIKSDDKKQPNIDPGNKNKKIIKRQYSGRENYGSGALIDSGALGGFGSSTINKINAAANRASDALRLGDARPHESGVFLDKTGYMAFHELYLFLMRYKKRAVEKPEKNKSPLLNFINYKDNNQYSCTVQAFSLERSAEDPMLYNYSIQLRAYNLRSIGSDKAKAIDQKKRFGLDGIKVSVLARARNTISNARAAINSTISAVKGAGR